MLFLIPCVKAQTKPVNNVDATAAFDFSGLHSYNWVDDLPGTGLTNKTSNTGSYIASNTRPYNGIAFNLTTNPAAAATPVITADAATGSISACAGTASVYPLVQEINVSAGNLTGDIMATAPPNFEISLNENSGYSNSATLTQSLGTVGAGIFVRSSAIAPAGSISGNVTFTSPGATAQTVAVNGIVNALPQVDGVSNQTYTAGTLTTGVSFSGAANNYTWFNNTPGIGLAASGTGNISPFTAVNNGTTPVTAAVIVTPLNAGMAYIPNYSDGTVSVISTQTNSIAGKINVGVSPDAVAISPDGTTVFVANQGDNSISVISAAGNSLLTTIPYGTSPNSMAITPDGSTLYVTNSNSNTVGVVNATIYQVETDIVVGNGDLGIVVSPDGSKVYVANEAANSVSVISTATNTVTATISVIGSPKGIAISPDGTQLYITNAGSNYVSVANTATNVVVKNITVGSGPSGVVFSPDGKWAYVTNNGSGTVSVIEVATGQLYLNIPAGSGPSGITLTPGGQYAYVTNQTSNNVSVISTATNKVIATVPVGNMPVAFGNFIASTSGCNGVAFQFTITVNPTSIVPPAINAGSVTGNISTCAGTASVSPQIEQFTVSGSNLTRNITATASADFEVSLNASTGYGTSVAITQAGGTVYVRAAATAPTGSIPGYVTLSSAGAVSQTVAVTGIVNALPTANIVANQTVANGAATTAVNFAGTGNTFNWVNDTPGIGLAGSGTGNIASFTATNPGANPIIATITATATNTGFAYITNLQSNTVSVINTMSNTVTATIPVGMQPLGVALSPDNNTVYVTNFSDNTVSVINTKTNQVTLTIPVGQAPWAMAISPDGSRLYVIDEQANTVSVITTATNTVTATIPVGSVPRGICISPDGSFIYVANIYSSVSVINTQTNQVVATISLSSYPTSLCISPDGSRLYVLDEGSGVGSSAGNVSVINTATNTVLSAITVIEAAKGIAISPDGSTLYVTNFLQGTVLQINISNNSITTSIPVGGNPMGIAISPDGSLVYVSNQGSGSVSVFSTIFEKVIATVPVGSSPTSYGNFVSGGSICSGAPVKFTITVNPASAAPPAVNAGSVTGNISACAGTASVSPQIEQFTVSGSNLTGNITAAASTGFEVSLNASTGYGTSVAITQAGGTVSNAVVYVRSAATAPAGSIPGAVILSSTGITSQTVTVTGTINALPAVNGVTNQIFTNGAITTATDFSGTGSLFTWVNDTPGIGLPANGTGNIPSFTATNTGSSPVNATITVTPAPNLSGFAYITNDNANTVSAINIATNKVVATINVGTNPSGVAVSPDGSRVYIVNSNSSTVSVISTASNTVIATVPIGQYSFGAVVSPDGSHVYVANTASGTVSVINTATNTLGATITAGSGPFCVAVSPDGSELFVTENESSGSVLVINTVNNTVKATIPVGSFPIGVTVSPDGKLVYVANEYSDNISVISAATNAVVSTIPVGSSPYGIALSPDGSTLYVANTGSGSVSVINTAADAVTATIPVQQVPSGISVSPDGSLVYVANSASGTVSVINTATNAVTTNVTVGQGPYALGNFIAGGAGCSGVPVKFTITVNPSSQAAITAEGDLPPLVTTYGTPSAATILKVSGNSLAAGILVTPPDGFQLSADGVTFSKTLTLGSGGNISAMQVYIRLAAITPVGEYSGPIILTSNGATPDTVSMPVSTVNPAPLTIIADNKTKIYGAENPVLTASYDGFVIDETPAVLTSLPVLSTTAVTLSPVGEYLISVSGAQAANYSISYRDGVLSIAPPEQDIFIPNTFTPNGDGVNDTWNIRYLEAYTNCSVNIFTRWGKNVFSSIGYGAPWDGTYSGKPLPMGTYYYVINLKNGGNPLAGFVLIVR